MMQKLLVVEDDQKIRDELVTLLQRNGYDACALTSFVDVPGQILQSGADLVLLDLNLPGVDGQHVCREVRQKSNVAIIAVTSRNSDLDELMMLSLGADDFVAKPYNTQILLLHIATEPSAEITHGGVTLDTAACRVHAAGGSAELTKNELRILAILMRNAGTVVSRQRIQEELWQSDEFVDDNTLTVNVSHLRQTLAGIGVEEYVSTRRGLGYIVI